MAKKRRKKASTRVSVSKATLDKVISMGAGHHALLKQLKRAAKAVPKRKAAKKAGKKRAKRRKSR